MEVDKTSSGTKRKRDNEDSEPVKETQKCTVQEGFSWWTCLMYDMPKSMSKPQPVPKESPN